MSHHGNDQIIDAIRDEMGETIMDRQVSHCYTDGQLTEAIDGEMLVSTDAFADDKMRYHLATCGDCAERMKENVELEYFVSSLLK
jgi:hypothetical protein